MKHQKGEGYNYVSLFSSAGVGCYGFKMEDFDCIVTNELLEERMAVQRYNDKCRHQTGYITGDITDAKVRQAIYQEIDEYKQRESVSDVDVLIATPPCQGMSTANYKKNDEIRRNSLVVEAITFVENINPKVFIFENVRAFLKSLCIDSDEEILSIEECIKKHLEKSYNIYSKVINFKDYGVPSSRPRTVVIGTRKDLLNVSPLNIFPFSREPISLREAIGHLKSLRYGEIDEHDVLHFARKYPEYMEEWIATIAEGQSAFTNEDQNKRPYKMVNGRRVALKGSYLGNKFKRLKWDEPSACIATRNDQLASQSTIHPTDNRVLSIREIMKVMSVPDEFKWTDIDLHNLDKAGASAFLRSNELAIRRSLGEAVPTEVFRSLAHNIRQNLDFEAYVQQPTHDYNKKNFLISSYVIEMNMNHKDKKNDGVFYTPQSVVFDVVKSFERNKKNEPVRVLEPAVGMGAFLPQLLKVLDGSEKIIMDLYDIDLEVLKALKATVKNIGYVKTNLEIHYLHKDYLLEETDTQYDIIASNPPYVKVDTDMRKKYSHLIRQYGTSNLYGLFLGKFINRASDIFLVVPKTFLMTPEFNTIRALYQSLYGPLGIVDYGVRYFKDVFVEIISMHIRLNYRSEVRIEDRRQGIVKVLPHGYIYHHKHWLIYRDAWFDDYIKSIRLGVFDFYRDRQITNKYLSNSGAVRILRSKNLTDNGSIIDIQDYDKYVDSVSDFTVRRFLNSNSIVMTSFTYNTRATILPNNTVPNGSLAVLLPKGDVREKTVNLALYSTSDFRKYYAIIKNKSKFTINIDANSIYYIGIKI